MSEMTDVEADVVLPGIGLRPFLAGLLVLVLVAGSLLLGDRASIAAPYPNASTLIADLYASGGDAFAAAWEPRSFAGLGLDPAAAGAELDSGFLDPSTTPVEETVVVVAGVPLVIVSTSEGATWCVRPDGVVLPLCRIGDLDVSVASDGLVGNPQIVNASLSLTQGVGVTILMEPGESEARTLTGPATLDGVTGGWQLRQFDSVVDGQIFPAQAGSYQFGGAFGLGILLESSLAPAEGECALLGATCLAPIGLADFGIVLEGVRIQVTIPAPILWLE
jgi:hypothetical protein